MTIAAAI
ncbi:putative membrane protein, partial [Yersinia pestis PY-65]